MAVGVDLHLDAAIAEDAFGHDSDEVDAFDVLADNEGGRLVVGISGAGTDRGHELPGLDERAVPVLRFAGKGDGRPAPLDRMLQDDKRIEPDDPAIAVAVAVAGTAAAV